MKRTEKCPKCGSRTSTRFCSGGGPRDVLDYCLDQEGEGCSWMTRPYTPDKKPVRTAKRYHSHHGGWRYEAFDGLGQIMVSSQSFVSREACEREAREEIQRATDGGYAAGTAVAVIWPPSADVRGKLIRARAARKTRA